MHAVVIGQSNIVGRPMALELLMSAARHHLHSKTRDLPGSSGRRTSSSPASARPTSCRATG
jgi:5,10-methylene-tetrahydrofolate dehydrogenase/methenyl tetrahydrofolate cyclohydrolase